MESALRRVLEKATDRREIKWANVSADGLSLYRDLVDQFFCSLECSPSITYRQIFLDRSFVYLPKDGTPTRSDLDVQYRVCYQFLKHSFGLQYLPRAEGTFDKIFIRLDSHSSQEHTESLKRFTQDLPTQLQRTDLLVDVSFVNSKKHLRLQLCDVLMGAAGSHGNKMHLRRQPSQRGMSQRQRARNELAKHIYNKLRQLDARLRGSAAFNWFESTGLSGDPKNQLRHKIRLWKFIPATYQRDKGWNNDRLDKFGRYQGPFLVPGISMTPPGFQNPDLEV